LVLNSPPTESEWPQILAWWQGLGWPELAVRSSAAAEDSAQASFAGQNKTYLNVKSEAELKTAVADCFASVSRTGSMAYRQAMTAQNSATGMNIVLQKMVRAKFAGVYFSQDPRHTKPGWILEVIAGLGEDLVSGKVTPGRVREDGEATDLPPGFTRPQAKLVAYVGGRVSQALGFPVDMEWAFDDAGEFFVLQARPITTAQSETDWVSQELERLQKTYHSDTVWDGQTFAEWSGLPSHLTYSIWRKAFSPHHAFGEALKRLGYRSFADGEWRAQDSLLVRVFGRASFSKTSKV
jgi:phosphoenolpyruvate synthase/pyruvate phosphate dikinase